MEERHIYLLKQHRNKFMQSVSKVELLYPMLHRFLSPGDIHEIERASEQPDKVAKLLDILPIRGSQVFSTLCVALETTYPHLLTVMFLGNVGSHSLYGFSPGLSPTFGQGMIIRSIHCRTIASCRLCHTWRMIVIHTLHDPICY